MARMPVFAHAPRLELLESRTLFSFLTPVTVGVETPAGSELTGDSAPVSVSEDGRYVLFTSLAINLFEGQSDTNDSTDIFLYDRVSGVTTVVSRSAASPTTTGDDKSFEPVMSRDGRFVAFRSFATNLVADQPDFLANSTNVFLFDRESGTTILVSHPLSSETDLPTTEYPSISADGRFVTYSSNSFDLVPGQVIDAHSAGVGSHVFLFDRDSGENIMIDRAVGPHPGDDIGGNQLSINAVVSADGRYVAYESLASNLVEGQIDRTHPDNIYAAFDVFLYDRVAGVSTLVSHVAGESLTATDIDGNGYPSSYPRPSADGRFVTYVSSARNLVEGQFETSDDADLFVYDRSTRENTLITHRFADAAIPADNPPALGMYSQRISDDGRYITFTSTATNLLEGQNDLGGDDIFLYDRATGGLTVLTSTDGTQAAGTADSHARISANARSVVYGQSGQVYLYEIDSGTKRLVSCTPRSVADGAGGYDPVISANGAYVAFASAASDLGAPPGDPAVKVYLFHLLAAPDQFIQTYDAAKGEDGLVDGDWISTDLLGFLDNVAVSDAYWGARNHWFQDGSGDVWSLWQGGAAHESPTLPGEHVWVLTNLTDAAGLSGEMDFAPGSLSGITTGWNAFNIQGIQDGKLTALWWSPEGSAGTWLDQEGQTHQGLGLGLNGNGWALSVISDAITPIGGAATTPPEAFVPYTESQGNGRTEFDPRPSREITNTGMAVVVVDTEDRVYVITFSVSQRAIAGALPEHNGAWVIEPLAQVPSLLDFGLADQIGDFEAAYVDAAT